jgi:Ca2+:H+ antiporter
MSRWTWIVPLASMGLLGVGLVATTSSVVAVLCTLGLIGSVVASVHHAEVVAHRVGEPYGTLVLALAVTVIEASLILSMMLSGGPETAVLPRDTLFAAVMIICNGTVGLCVLLGGLQHREQSFRIEGASAGMGVLVALATLSLVLPAFSPTDDPTRSPLSHLLLAGVSSLLLWGVFVFAQTVRHRDYFLPPSGTEDETQHAAPPTKQEAWQSFGLLLVSLVAVVGLAKVLSPTIEGGLVAAGAPQSALGVAIAMVVLAPETWAAARAAQANRLQTSMNLALGSALASIGLTVPVVAIASVVLDLPVLLGLGPEDVTMVAVTFMVSAFTLAQGRTNIVQGAVHLVLFAGFLFLALVP